MSEKPDSSIENAMLNHETGRIAWEELARHFARGVVIRIDRGLDLVVVAQAILNDDAAQVGQWQSTGALGRASDDDARRWNAENSEFWAVVIAPWVIVQEIDASVQPREVSENTQLH